MNIETEPISTKVLEGRFRGLAVSVALHGKASLESEWPHLFPTEDQHKKAPPSFRKAHNDLQWWLEALLRACVVRKEGFSLWPKREQFKDDENGYFRALLLALDISPVTFPIETDKTLNDDFAAEYFLGWFELHDFLSRNMQGLATKFSLETNPKQALRECFPNATHSLTAESKKTPFSDMFCAKALSVVDDAFGSLFRPASADEKTSPVPISTERVLRNLLCFGILKKAVYRIASFPEDGPGKLRRVLQENVLRFDAKVVDFAACVFGCLFDLLEGPADQSWPCWVVKLLLFGAEITKLERMNKALGSLGAWCLLSSQRLSEITHREYPGAAVAVGLTKGHIRMPDLAAVKRVFSLPQFDPRPTWTPPKNKYDLEQDLSLLEHKLLLLPGVEHPIWLSVHTNSCCDNKGCSFQKPAPIIGDRYKHKSRIDYDLCAECWEKHRESIDPSFADPDQWQLYERYTNAPLRLTPSS